MLPKSFFAALAMLVTVSTVALAEPSLKALIVDGQNNHGVWPKTTKMMKKYLEDSGLFSVDVSTHAPRGVDPNFKPEFSKYDVVVSNFGHGAAEWPQETKEAFVKYVESGGGFVVVHAANNSYPKWKEYNEMIGLGGWGGRNETSGPYVYFDKGELIRDESKGRGGSHGPQHPFAVIIRDDSHPITKGMPGEWLHAKDELYDRLRGPAQNMKVLGTSLSRSTKRHEPMLMTIDFGKGRVFHTPMGHAVEAQECVGFIASLQRGAEWAATGKVTQKIPGDFPTADESRFRKFE